MPEMCSCVKLLMRRNGSAHAAIALANMVAEDARDDENQRQNGEGQKRQPPIDGEHDGGHDGQREGVIDDGQHAVGKHVVDGVHVGGEARDQAADGVNIEESDVHALHVAENVAAQIEHDLLADPLHQVNLDELEEVGRDQECEVNCGKPRDALHRSCRKNVCQRALVATQCATALEGSRSLACGSR